MPKAAAKIPKDQGRSCNLAGNPVNIRTGNKFERVTDFETAGPDAIAFTRYYNSQYSAHSSLGNVWRHSFERTMGGNFSTPLKSTSLYIHRPDGRRLVFTFNSITGVWSSDADVTLKVATVGSTIEVTEADDSVEAYDGTSARLLSIRKPNGYRQTLAYDANGRLATVGDTLGRQLGFAYDADGYLTSVTDPAGKVYTYSHEVAVGTTKRLAKVGYPDDTPADATDNPSVSYLYEDPTLSFSITGILDEKGARVASFSYDAYNRVVAEEHAGGADRMTVAYNDSDGSRTITNALGKQTVARFTTIRKSPKLTTLEGQASLNCSAANTSYAYDTNGFLSSVTDWNGNVTKHVFNTRGLETSRTEAFGKPEARTVTTTWHATLRRPTQVVEPGRTTDFTYDAAGLLLTRTETDTTSQTVPYSTTGRTRAWTYTYTAQGLLAAVNGPRTDVADVTGYAYDANGYLQSVTNALNQVTTVTAVDGMGRPLSLSDANGVVTDLAYTPRGWLKSATVRAAAGDATTLIDYDAAGLVTTVALPTGAQLSYGYDAAHRLTSVATGDGERIEHTLDGLGHPTQIQVKSAAGAVVRSQTRAYDELGRLLRIVGAASQTWSYAYDANGNLTSITDPRSTVTGQGFDALNRLVSASAPLQASSAFAYDARDRLSRVTDPRGVVTTYTYDGFGSLIQEASPDAGTTVYEVDAAGNRTKRTDARGVVTEYAYDALNRRTAESYPASPGESLAFAYDDVTPGTFGIGRLAAVTGNGLAVSYAYDARGNRMRESRTAHGLTAVTGYAYDLADALAEVTYPSGRIVRATRDGQGRVTAVSMRADAAAPEVALASAITHQPFGAVASMTLGNGLALTRGYDGDGRLSDLTVSGPGGAVQDLGYAYDAAGNVTAITDRLAAARSQSFSYDALDRLTQGSGAYGSIGYGYDAAGNRTSRTVDSGGTVTNESYAYPAASNRLASVSGGSPSRTLSHSASGQLTGDDRGGTLLELVYNGADRFTELRRNGATDTTYRYDHQGRRVSKQIGASRTDFHYDAAGHLLAESDGTGAVLREYVWLGDVPLALVADPSSDPRTYWVHADHLGTPQTMTDGTGAVAWDATWGPFGEAFSLSGFAVNSLRFPGQQADEESGWHANWWRTYDPPLGRYVQSDPIGLKGGLNRYAYVDGNPLRYTDPTGENPLVIPLVSGLGRVIAPTVGMATGVGVGEFLSKLLNKKAGDGEQEESAPDGQSCPKPKGIPEDWDEKPSKKGGGSKWQNPKNPDDWVRSMPGDPNSPNPAQREPYTKRHQGGTHRDVNGNPVRGDDPASHIPTKDFTFRP